MSVGHGGLYHSQSPEGFFLGASGLKVSFLSYALSGILLILPQGRYPTFADSSQRSPSRSNPGSKSRNIHGAQDPLPFCRYVRFLLSTPRNHSDIQHGGLVVEQVPMDDYEIPLGKAETLTRGSDLTVLTWGTPVYHCETALHMLSSPPESLAKHIPASVRSAKVELIDLRTILPWDVETVTESVRRTGRLVIVHEASRTGGVGGEIAAEIQNRCFLKLNAPVKRVTGWE